MKKYPIAFSLLALCLAACASTSNPPGPEGTGEHKAGYYLGRSDTVKQEYWIVQNQQKNLHPAPQPLQEFRASERDSRPPSWNTYPTTTDLEEWDCS